MPARRGHGPLEHIKARNHRNLSAARFHSLVHRRHDYRMRARIARTPDANSVSVDHLECFGKDDRIPVVVDLSPGIDMSAWQAIAFSMTAVVVDQRGQARAAECLADLVQ